MISAISAQKIVLKAIKKVLAEEADIITSQVYMDWAQYGNLKLGNAEIEKQKVIHDEAKRLLNLVFYAKGQRALIAEYGKGSKLDRTNPVLQEYLNGTVFNRDRLKFNLATASRVKDGNGEFYYDLDGKPHRKGTTKLRNRETGLDEHGNVVDSSVNPAYKPIEPRHIVAQAIRQRLNIICMKIITAIVASNFATFMINGLRLKVTL